MDCVLQVSMSDGHQFEVDEKIDPNKIFEKDDASSADFEITFAALIATAVLGFPNGSQSFTYVKLAGVSLLLVTLIRRMAILSSYSQTKKITDSTTALLLLLTYVCFLYLLERFATAVSIFLSHLVSPVLIMGVSTAVIFVLFIAAQEFIFRDLFLYTAISSFNSGVNSDNEIFQQKFAELAVISAKSSLAGDDFPSTLNWIRYSTASQPDSPKPLDEISYYVGIASVLLLYLISWGVAVVLLAESLLTLIVFATTLVVSIPVKFLYERYGLTPLISERRTSTDVSALVFGFLFAVWVFV